MDDAKRASLFDGTAANYDQDVFHPMVASALVEGLDPAPELLLDVATGTGEAAFAALKLKAVRVLAADISPGMIALARKKAASLDPEGRITWHTGPAVPMPAASGTADAVVCASALHFLGAAALADWRRLLRPGGQVAFSISRAPSATSPSSGPSDAFDAAMPTDLTRPSNEAEAAALATSAGFEDASARLFTADLDRPRRVFLVQARQPR